MTTLKRTALWLTLLALLVKFSGFLRESIIAKQFGVSEYTDGYLLAFSFITLTLAMISGGFNNVFLPLYIKHKKTDHTNADQNANSILNYALILFLVLTIVGLFFVPQMVTVIFGDMTPLTEKVAIEVMRIFVMSMIFIALNAILDSFLQSRRIFVPSQISKLLGTIMGALFALLFSDIWGIHSLAYGFVFGIFLGVVLQVFYLAKSGFKWMPTLHVEPEFKHSFITLLIPALLNSVVGQMNMFIDKMFASSTAEGAVTYLNNASLLVSIPHAIYGTTVAVILFTLLSEQIDNHQKFQHIFTNGLHITLITLLPIAVGLFIIGDSAISFIYERGRFTSEDSYHTYIALLFYLPMIVTQGLQYIVSKSMYAKGKTVIILKVSLTTIIMNVILNYLLVKPLGYPGLALSSSLVSLFYLSVTTFFMYKEFDKGESMKIVKMLIRMIPPLLLMDLPLLAIQKAEFVQSSLPITQIFIIATLGVGLYVIGTYLFNKQGFILLIDLVKNRKNPKK